jgi:hypothetical protein
MSVKLVDHSWHKIVEGDALAKVVLRDKIAQIQQLEETIRSKDGADAARNVLDNGLIVHALKRCLEHLEGSDATSEQDFLVCYYYATTAAEKAEKILNEDGNDED